MRGSILKKLLAASLFVAVIGLMASMGPQSKGQEKKAKGRLPAYYGDIVNDAQRQSIYAIQDKYAKQIAALNDQLDALTKQRDTEVENVLTPEQKTKLIAVKEEAGAKKKKNAEDKKVANAAPAAAAPADTKKPANGQKPKQ